MVVTGERLGKPKLGDLVSQYFAGDLHAAVGVAGLMSGVGRYARFVDEIVARYLRALTDLEVAEARRNMDSNPSMITPSERALSGRKKSSNSRSSPSTCLPKFCSIDGADSSKRISAPQEVCRCIRTIN